MDYTERIKNERPFRLAFSLLLRLYFRACISVIFLAQVPALAAQIPAPAVAPGAVTLLFLSAPDNSIYQPRGLRPVLLKDLSYFHDDGQRVDILLAHDRDTNVVIIPTDRDRIEISHIYRAWGNIPFVFHRGDSVLIRYEGFLPYAEVINRDVTHTALNFASAARARIAEDGFWALEKMALPLVFDQITRPGFNLKDYERNYWEQATAEIGAQSVWLDSLLKTAEMPPDAGQFFQRHIDHHLACLQYRQDQVGKIASELLLHAPEAEIYSPAFHATVGAYVQEQITGKMPFISTSNAKFQDFRKAFEQLETDPSLGVIAREVGIYGILEPLVQYFPAQDALHYLDRFDAVYAVHLSADSLRRKYRLGEAPTQGLALQTASGEAPEWTDFLASQRGNVVYVDFWASWCRPCIASFPDAAQLRASYQGRPVVFVYLSVDESLSAWRTAAARYELGQHSFWIQNVASSLFLKNLDLESIPRYLLYDKTGALVHRNAPGPGGEEIGRLLEGYLGE